MNAQMENDVSLFIHYCSCKWRADETTGHRRWEWNVQPKYEFMATKYRAKRWVNSGLTVISLTPSQHQMNVCTNNWKWITLTGPNHLMQTLTKAQGKPWNVPHALFLPDNCPGYLYVLVEVVWKVPMSARSAVILLGCSAYIYSPEHIHTHWCTEILISHLSQDFLRPVISSYSKSLHQRLLLTETSSVQQ